MPANRQAGNYAAPVMRRMLKVTKIYAELTWKRMRAGMSAGNAIIPIYRRQNNE